jgi:SOS-response transcriptional repressor LexA
VTGAEERLAAALQEAGRSKAQARVTSRAALPILEAVAALTMEGPSPSIREVADEAGVGSTSTVGHHLKTLAELKLVDLPPKHRPRSLRVTDAGVHLLNGPPCSCPVEMPL